MAHSEVPMKMVVSSNIVAIGYDATTLKLHILFKGKSHYVYKDVPSSLHDEFLASESKGHFFSQKIKGKYKFDQED